MRKCFYFLLVAMLCYGFVACDTEENKENEVENEWNEQPEDNGDSNNNYSKNDFTGHWENIAYANSETTAEIISFMDTVVVYEAYMYQGENEKEVIANGTYTVDGNIIYISYDDVYVYTSDDSNVFWGFTNKKGKNISYTIKSINETLMKLMDETGKEITFER